MMTIFVRLIQPDFVLLSITQLLGNKIIYTKTKRCSDVVIIRISKEYCSQSRLGSVSHSSQRMSYVHVEDPTVKCRTAIKVLFLYFKSAMLDSLSCSFTSKCFLTKLLRLHNDFLHKVYNADPGIRKSKNFSI